jgi:hypothetical protein
MLEDTVHIPAPMANVIIDLVRRREAQEAKYGHVNDLLEDGTGPGVEWLAPVVDVAQSAYTGRIHAKGIQEIFREDYEAQFDEKTRLPSWMHLVREELAEAFEQDDPARLEDELLDVAALCVSWIERLRKRAG